MTVLLNLKESAGAALQGYGAWMMLVLILGLFVGWAAARPVRDSEAVD